MAKLKLRAVDHGKDKNRYCGPSAISAVTKLTSGEAARLIRKQSGKSSVKGTSTSNIRRALEACRRRPQALLRVTPQFVDGHEVLEKALPMFTSSSTHQPRFWSKAEAPANMSYMLVMLLTAQ